MTDRRRVVELLAGEYRRLLPAQGFKVDIVENRVHVRAVAPCRSAGSTMIGPGFVTLMLPFPKHTRLQAFYEAEAKALRTFVLDATHRQWPAAGAAPHARVTPTHIHVWYGGDEEEDAVLRWEPVSRAAIGL